MSVSNGSTIQVGDTIQIMSAGNFVPGKRYQNIQTVGSDDLFFTVNYPDMAGAGVLGSGSGLGSGQFAGSGLSATARMHSPIRTYNIKEAGGGNNSLYAYWGYNGIAGSYWGDPGDPVHQRADPGESRPAAQVDGRTYQFYFNGSHINMVAFIEHGTAYWVQNTLRDDMSNADMIAIARSLKPVK